MKSVSLWTEILALAFLAGAGLSASADGLLATFTSRYLDWSIDDEGRTVAFVERAGGTNLLGAPTPLATLAWKGQEQFATSAELKDGLVVLEFGGTGVSVTLSVESREEHFVVDVVSMQDAGELVETLHLLRLPLQIDVGPGAPVACTVFARNLKTYVPAIPGAARELHATAHRRFGFAGASVAVVAAPPAALRDALKAAVSRAEGIPRSSVGGPWALDADMNRESYLIALSGGVTEGNVEEWIEVAHRTGARQINFHAGVTLRFGDYEPNPQFYPRGIESLRAVVDRLHEAGIMAGLHTYSQFIAKDTPWVTPVPDPRLAYVAQYTLAERIDAESALVPVLESTGQVSTTTGFHIRNSVTLRIGEELLVFEEARGEAPFGFAKVTRGAHGTRASAHEAGAEVFHLKECFGLFAPDGDSGLYEEVAARTAHVYNTAGFDLIYLDAIDGSDIIAGYEYAWHYGAKFLFEVARRLEKPALFEMSAFWHHFWFLRSRMGAWDASARGIKPFVDMHVITNRDTERIFLPSNLGWLAAFRWNPLQPERTLPDHLEYVLGKSIAHDSSLSLLVGFQPDDFQRYEHSRMLADLIRRYETLRLQEKVPAQVREQLAVPGAEFTLEAGDDGRERFYPVDYAHHRVSGPAGSALECETVNPHGPQPLRVRIESLTGLAAYDAPDGLELAAMADAAEFPARETNEGVQLSLSAADNPALEGLPSMRLSACSERGEADTAWAMATKRFDPPISLAERGLGLWVHGDGSGALLNVQVRSPKHLGGGQANRYLDLDFTGWRYVQLVELEGERIVDFEWPDMIRRQDWEAPGHSLMSYAYPTLHTHVAFHQIESLSLFLNNVPESEAATVHLSPIRALPLVDLEIHNPSVTVNGTTITFPVRLPSGYYLEYQSPTHCKVYDREGSLVEDVTPSGPAPELAAGTNRVCLQAQEANTGQVRARVTVITRGTPLTF